MRQAQLNGTTLSYQDQGEGAPLLLVHGFPLDHSMWRHQIEYFSATHRVVAPDLRGFGASLLGHLGDREVSDEPTVTMRQYADDLASLLDTLGITGQVAFCGLSMGGYIGWQFWQAHGDRLRCLIQCDTRAAADTAEVARGRRMMAQQVIADGAESVARAMIPRLFAAETPTRQPDIVEQTWQVICATQPKSIAAAQRGMAERPDSRDQLADINVPTLLLCGEHDVISPPAEMREIARGIRHATFVQINGVGHMAPLEDPATTNQAIADFLAGH
jgi:pimeloyl-ACP methyl ester carboxylesterase